MNTTHGPFFHQGNKLPPLSALHKHERSTKDSDRENMVGTAVGHHRRAATNMDVRTLDLDNEELVVGESIGLRSSAMPHDPFYS